MNLISFFFLSHDQDKLYTFQFYEIPFHNRHRLMLHVIPPDSTGPEVFAHVAKSDFKVKPHEIDLRATNGTQAGKFSFGIFELHKSHTHKAMRLGKPCTTPHSLKYFETITCLTAKCLKSMILIIEYSFESFW